MKMNFRMLLKFSYLNKMWKLFLMFLCLILSGFSVFAQNTQTITGTIADDKNEPLPGVSIVLKGTTTGTITDFDGNFTISIPAGDQILEISFVGMQTQEITVSGTRSINVVMKESAQSLEEVVVVGYGTQRKESVVGAITQTSGRVLERTGGVSDLGMALTGNLPGVITMSSTGMPGEEDPRIVIRGRSSWNSTDPLVLVDGIERPMNSVDINSVESISVLKDASATAVFGVRGANGVILITTKRGQDGKASINFNFSATMKTPSRLPKKYDSYDALMFLNQAIENELAVNPDSWGQIYPYEIIEKFRNPANQEEAERYPNVDWRKETLKDFAMSYNANMSISGGTKFVKYFANLDYQREGDIYKEIDNNRGYKAGYGFDRMNVRSNLDFSLTPTTTLKVGLSGSHGVKKGPESGNINLYTAWTAVYVTAPDAMMPRYSDGIWGFHAPNYTDGSQLNPLTNMGLRGIEYTTTDRINTDFSLNQDLSKLLKGLSARALLSFDNEYREGLRGVNDLYRSDYQTKYIDPRTGVVSYLREIDATNKFDFQESVSWDSRAGQVSSGSVYRKLYYSVQLNYANTFFEKHNVTAMGDFNRQEEATGSRNPLYREDWVFRVTYDYARRYLLELNGAYDGSSQFSSERRFDFFPSGALGWMVSEESFVKNLNLKWLDMLKLRTSYGKIGSDKIEGKQYAYMTTWDLRTLGNGDRYGFRQSILGESNTYAYDMYYESNVGNLDLHWETVAKFNLGVDYSFLDRLISGSFEIFRDKRRDVFISGNGRAVPSYYGASPASNNSGAVDVKGLEFELRLNKSFKNDLRLWGNFAYSHAIEKVIERDDPELLANYRKQAGYAVNQPRYHVDAGYINNWDELYGSAAHDMLDGTRTPGSFIILDYDADGVISADDNIPYSFSRTPQNTFNATIGADYKGWSCFVQFYGVTNVTREVSYTSLEHSTRHTVYEYQGNYWTRDNLNADWPKLIYGARQSSYATGTRYNFDASYLRLKNVEIGYTFTDEQNWVRAIGIKSLKLYLNGNNVWLFSKMPDDRESNNDVAAYQGAYPTMKRFNLGLRLSL